jgi:outer membrane protein assembly factor BamB
MRCACVSGRISRIARAPVPELAFGRRAGLVGLSIRGEASSLRLIPESRIPEFTMMTVHTTRKCRFARLPLFSLLFCGLAAISGSGSCAAADWPQWLGPQRDGVWRESGILEAFPKDGPKLRWRAEIGGGYAGPAVAEGRVFVHDRLVDDLTDRDKQQNFKRGVIDGIERALCFDEKNGKLLWEIEYDCTYTVSYPAGPRVTPLVHGGKVYFLGAEGNLMCLDAKTGKQRWGRNLRRDFGAKTPLWGFAAHPLIDGDKLICLVGGRNSTVVAFNKNSGKEIWRSLSARELGYCPPMIYEAGGKRQLIIWHPEAVNSLNPENGKVYWTQPFKIRSGLTIATPRKHGDLLFVSAFYNGPMALQLDAEKPAASVLWRGSGRNEKNTDGLHSLMATPFIEGDHIYGVCSYGELRCLELKTGKRIWETFKPTTGGKPIRWGNAFIVKQGDRFFLHNETGDLIIAKLSPAGYEEISRASLLKPTSSYPRRPVVWSHPAFANRSVYARNDKELVCYSLAAEANAAE